MRGDTMSGFMSTFFRFGEYFVLLLYLNLLWICSTLLGGIIFGWAPSTVAMFAVIRKSIRGEDAPVFTMFWSVYRQEFIRVNGLGLLFMAIALIGYVNIQFFQVETKWLSVSVRYMMIGIMLLSGAAFLYLFPLLVHYEASLGQHVKNAFLLLLSRPFGTLFTMIGCLVVTMILGFFPILIPFLGVSLYALVIMATTYHTFSRIELKQRTEQQAS